MLPVLSCVPALLCRQLKEKISYSALVRQLGVSGMYTGILATLVRDVPFSAVYFSLYANCKRLMLSDSSDSHSVGLKSLAAGAIAGTVAAAFSCPMDVVKTRVHRDAVPASLSLGPFLRREVELVTSTFRQIVQVEGAGALLKGIVPRCVIVSPLFAITMACYEQMQQSFG